MTISMRCWMMKMIRRMIHMLVTFLSLDDPRLALIHNRKQSRQHVQHVVVAYELIHAQKNVVRLRCVVDSDHASVNMMPTLYYTVSYMYRWSILVVLVWN